MTLTWGNVIRAESGFAIPTMRTAETSSVKTPIRLSFAFISSFHRRLLRFERKVFTGHAESAYQAIGVTVMQHEALPATSIAKPANAEYPRSLRKRPPSTASQDDLILEDSETKGRTCT
jgi:hypothetical protein